VKFFWNVDSNLSRQMMEMGTIEGLTKDCFERIEEAAFGSASPYIL
jgi:hypothetical protein